MTDHSARPDQPALKTNRLCCGGSRLFRVIQAALLCFAWLVVLSFAAQAQELSNDTLRLKLGVTPEGVPVIEEAVWQASGRTAFRDLGTPEGLVAWGLGALIPADRATPTVWEITEGADLTTAVATCDFPKNVSVSWVVELPKQGQLFRLHVRVTNGGKRSRAFETFPAWSASWDVGGQAQWARWWRSLEYNRVERVLDANAGIRLGSRRHSSDDVAGGVNPYWMVGGSDSLIFFGLQWCGGWTAKLQSVDNGFSFSAGLPSEETQLVLASGESVEGPALLVTPMPGSDAADNRMSWMRQRRSMGEMLYPGPPLSFPLTYNHWYAVRRQVDNSFLNMQIAAMSPYSFDAFIVDAGWFADGRWKPERTKFGAGEFVEMLASLKASGVKPGLWSTPQYVSENNTQSTLTIDQPSVLSNFTGGYLADMSQTDFPAYLTEHVQTLRHKYSIEYWKYDHPLFSEQSLAGEMKNVIGFQTGIKAVREANPDLIIENCLNGGRMINEFTLMATQATWLSDLGGSGLPDPRGNISVALNAMDFIFPWAALRFTINLDRLDQNDDEMLRLYCRSAMAGIWGISTDLSKVSERQQGVVLSEIENYRRLSRLKFSCLYDLQPPSDSADVAGITFYGRRRLQAGILLYRWRRDGAFDQQVLLSKLKPWATYRVVDTDTGTEFIASGGDLISTGVTVPFSAQRQSALLFVEPVIQSPEPSQP